MDDLKPAEKAWMDRVDEAWHESMGSPDSLGTRMRWFTAGYAAAEQSRPLATRDVLADVIHRRFYFLLETQPDESRWHTAKDDVCYATADEILERLCGSASNV